MTPGFGVAQVRYRSMLDKRTRPTLIELNKRRENAELNQMLKDGKVEHLKRAGEGLFNQQAELVALQSRLGEKFDQRLLAEAMVTPGQVEKDQEHQWRLGVEVEEGARNHSELASAGMSCIKRTLDSWITAAVPNFPSEGRQEVVEHLTSEQLLAEVGFHIGLKELVLSPVYPPTREELATSFKAVVGALARTDEGRAKQLVVDLVASQLHGKDLNELWSVRNPMRELTATLKSMGKPAPESRLLWENAPGSILASYTVGIYVDRELIGESPGETVESAEEMAARDALRNLHSTTEHAAPLPWAKLPPC